MAGGHGGIGESWKHGGTEGVRGYPAHSGEERSQAAVLR